MPWRATGQRATLGKELFLWNVICVRARVRSLGGSTEVSDATETFSDYRRVLEALEYMRIQHRR